MDRYRSPQSFTFAAINISQPRPLRPHGFDESATTSVSNTPATASHALPRHTPVIPHGRSPAFGAQYELPADEHGVLQTPVLPPGGFGLVRSEESRLDAVDGSEYRGSWMGRGFLGTLMRGLGKTRKAMEKHHSRQSLYEEYAAEAHAAALRNSQMSPNMRSPLQSIPESIDGDAVNSSRGPSSQETYEGTTAVNHDPAWPQPVWPVMGSPGYTTSQLTSEYSKRASSLGPLPPPDTWEYYYARILHFLVWLRDLPWSEERIVSDYIPARDGRGGFGAERPVNAWYKPKTSKGQADNEKFGSTTSPPVVLVVPATPPSGGSYGFGMAPPTSLPSMGPPVLPTPVLPSPLSDGAVTAIRPTHTPISVTSAGLSYMSPGMSSHGAGRQELTYSWYSGSPGPHQWPLHFSQFSSPQTQTRLGMDEYPDDGRYIDR